MAQESPRAQIKPIVMFALMVLVAWQASPAIACSTSKENCNVTKCCVDPDLTCYEKNAEYAVCTTSCKKGVHASDVGKWKTPWSCKPLNTDDCSTAKQNCNVTKCCQDDSLTCFEKNAEYAVCTSSCKKGIHASDVGKWKTPWSCNVLKPGVPSKKTVETTITKTGEKSPKVTKVEPKAKDSKGKKKSKCGDVFDKCGGEGYKGETCCLEGCKCHKFGRYHSSCQPANGHGHKCLQEMVMVEVNDAAAEDSNLTGKGFYNAGWVTKLVAALTTVGTVTSFVVFMRRLRRRFAMHQHTVVQEEELMS